MSKIIGVFDSGIGGLSVANAIQQAFPNDIIEYREDSKNVPYGTKTPELIHELITPIIKELAEKCDIIVIACNTVTTNLIETLRSEYDVPFIGIEPMVKPAAQLSSTKKITVCATPATLRSKRYQYLKNTYAKNISVFEPDCSDWSGLIEKNQFNIQIVKDDILPSLANGSDVIVLGCTHYHWVEQEVRELVGNQAIILQPEAAIISRLKAHFNE